MLASQKHLYPNACSTGNKKDGLGVHVQLQSYDVMGSQRHGKVAQVTGTL